MDEERAEAATVVVTVQEVEMDAGFRFLVRFASGLEKTSRMICDNMKWHNNKASLQDFIFLAENKQNFQQN